MQIGMKFATYARGCDKISFEASKNLDKTLPPYCAKDPFQMRGAVPEDSIRFCVVGVFFCNIVTYQSSRMERCFLHFAMFILAWTHYHKWQGKGAVVLVSYFQLAANPRHACKAPRLIFGILLLMEWGNVERNNMRVTFLYHVQICLRVKQNFKYLLVW